MLELLDLLKDLMGKHPKVSFADWRPADQKVYVSNIGKAEKLLGWRPKIMVEDGVKKLAAWTLSNLTLFR
ncbi:MAG: GDP-mannose 4,6-dehydratase [Nitrososphaeria archaeon]